MPIRSPPPRSHPFVRIRPLAEGRHRLPAPTGVPIPAQPQRRPATKQAGRNKRDISEMYRRCIGDVSEIYRTNTLSTPDPPQTFPLASRHVHAFIEPPPGTPRASPQPSRFKVQSSGFEVQGSAPDPRHPPSSILGLTHTASPIHSFTSSPIHILASLAFQHSNIPSCRPSFPLTHQSTDRHVPPSKRERGSTAPSHQNLPATFPPLRF